MIITITRKGESETCEISDVRMEVVPGLQESSDVYYLLWGEVMGEYRKVVIGIYYAMDELLAQYWTYKNELRKEVEAYVAAHRSDVAKSDMIAEFEMSQLPFAPERSVV